jgi:hypothetical protein
MVLALLKEQTFSGWKNGGKTGDISLNVGINFKYSSRWLQHFKESCKIAWHSVSGYIRQRSDEKMCNQLHPVYCEGHFQYG